MEWKQEVKYAATCFNQEVEMWVVLFSSLKINSLQPWLTIPSTEFLFILELFTKNMKHENVGNCQKTRETKLKEIKDNCGVQELFEDKPIQTSKALS